MHFAVFSFNLLAQFANILKKEQIAKITLLFN